MPSRRVLFHRKWTPCSARTSRLIWVWSRSPSADNNESNRGSAGEGLKNKTDRSLRTTIRPQVGLSEPDRGHVCGPTAPAESSSCYKRLLSFEAFGATVWENSGVCRRVVLLVFVGPHPRHVRLSARRHADSSGRRPAAFHRESASVVAGGQLATP